MTEPVEHPYFGTETDPGAAEPAELHQEGEPEPAEAGPPAPAPEAAAEPETPKPPHPDWLVEVRNNVGGIVGRAIEELYHLATRG